MTDERSPPLHLHPDDAGGTGDAGATEPGEQVDGTEDAAPSFDAEQAIQNQSVVLEQVANAARQQQDALLRTQEEIASLRDTLAQAPVPAPVPIDEDIDPTLRAVQALTGQVDTLRAEQSKDRQERVDAAEQSRKNGVVVQWKRFAETRAEELEKANPYTRENKAAGEQAKKTLVSMVENAVKFNPDGHGLTEAMLVQAFNGQVKTLRAVADGDARVQARAVADQKNINDAAKEIPGGMSPGATDGTPPQTQDQERTARRAISRAFWTTQAKG